MLTGLRTVLVNLLLTAIALIALLAPEESQNLPTAEQVGQAVDWLAAGLLIVWGPINILLRLVTKTPFPWAKLRAWLARGSAP